MRIVAIYIDKHEYLFDKPQTINFGGKYFYKFELADDSVTISREHNKNYIQGFFNLEPNIAATTNLSVIAGQNGAGKTSILDIIRSTFIDNRNALPSSDVVIIGETDIDDSTILIRSDFKKVFFKRDLPKTKGSRQSNHIALEVDTTKTFQTIYYSPHFDYRFNPNFSNVDNHDISFDKILENDLRELNQKDTKESGFPYSPNQELLFKNALRQINFLNSKLVKNKIFKDIFHLPEHNQPILVFRGYKSHEKDWNTPSAFRSALRKISNMIESELDGWSKLEMPQGALDKKTKQLQINKYILKRNVLSCILSLLYKQMEKYNSYLDKGVFPYVDYMKQIKGLDAYGSFILFLENCFMGPRTKVQIFDPVIIRSLIDEIYNAIDEVGDENNVKKDELITTRERANNILQLQRDFLNKLRYYFYALARDKAKIILSETDFIEEFVNYMPFSQKLSSGENALLNLFSRLYDFLHTNLIETQFRKKSDHYILLFDEPDLAFHPNWKKKFVKAILSTLPKFFDEIENKPTIQIIFTTHDPLTLSDIPNSNVVYIERKSNQIFPNILDFNDLNRPSRTFGANISDLLADSFFIESSLVGDFAFDKIRKTIEWLESNDTGNSEYHRLVIQNIDEPIVQRKLAEMFDEKLKLNFQDEIIDRQINFLQKLKKRKK